MQRLVQLPNNVFFINIIIVKEYSPLDNSTKLASKFFCYLSLNQNHFHLIKTVRILKNQIIILKYDINLLSYQLA
jgi:hypothetical protein